MKGLKLWIKQNKIRKSKFKPKSKYEQLILKYADHLSFYKGRVIQRITLNLDYFCI